jgi:prepilin-type N-terminal cleavage/methylation domain-containing protein
MKVINNKKGFTLIELLVVVAIIGILSSVGVVAYNGYTAGAKESACKGNFRTIVKAVYENIMWCELNPTINFLWNHEQSWEYDCNTMFYNGRDVVYQYGYTKNEKLARLTINEITITDLSRKADSNIGSRTTLKTMTNPYTGSGSVSGGTARREIYDGDRYDMRGSVSLLKRDSSGNELSNNWQSEGQLYLITKCRDKVIEHEFDIY